MENVIFNIISFLNDSKLYDEEQNEFSKHPLLVPFLDKK